jgi:hypothetical protein
MIFRYGPDPFPSEMVIIGYGALATVVLALIMHCAAMLGAIMKVLLLSP